MALGTFWWMSAVDYDMKFWVCYIQDFKIGKNYYFGICLQTDPECNYTYIRIMKYTIHLYSLMV